MQNMDIFICWPRGTIFLSITPSKPLVENLHMLLFYLISHRNLTANLSSLSCSSLIASIIMSSDGLNLRWMFRNSTMISSSCWVSTGCKTLTHLLMSYCLNVFCLDFALSTILWRTESLLPASLVLFLLFSMSRTSANKHKTCSCLHLYHLCAGTKYFISLDL